MGQQKFNLGDNLHVGDWAWFKACDCEQEEYNDDFILAFRYSEEHWAFYHAPMDSADCLFNGSDAPRYNSVTSEYPFLSQFSRSWIVDGCRTLRWGVSDLTDGRDFDLTIVTYSKPLPTDDTLSNDSSGDIATESTDDCSDWFSSNYERARVYRGFHGYHDHHGSYLNMPVGTHRGHRIGVELEVEFNRESLRDKFTEIETNWFYLERDGSLGSYGCEIITIPLKPSDAKSEGFWTPLTNHLSTRAKSWDTGRCGLHVHIGKEILGRNAEEQSETLGRLLYLYHQFVKDTRLNIKIYGRDRGYHDQDGKTSASIAARELGSEVLKIQSVKDKVKESLIDRAEDDRYFDINIRNSATIEFRKGRGSINPKRIAMVIDYCERMCIYAKSTPWQQIGYTDFVKFLQSTVQNEHLLEIINSYR
jgi:hypothetical protein